MRAVAIVAIIGLGLPLSVALGRYGTIQPCEMLALEMTWLRARAYDGAPRGPLNVIGARLALLDRSPAECLVALSRALTQDPVDVTLDCMTAELGPDSKLWDKTRFAAADRKCSSLQWFLWRQAAPGQQGSR